MLAAVLPSTAFATFTANLTWTASTDTNVTGYNIYYGGASGQYTNTFSIGAVTSVTVSNLADGVPYFFSAKAYDASGNESPFSNEAIFCGFGIDPGTCVQQAVLPANSTGDQLGFSLDTNAPPGAVIDPTNGVFAWSPDLSWASTTNVVTVQIADITNPGQSSTETLLVVVGDYLDVGLGSTVVQAGQTGSLPIILTASDNATNLQVTVNWPVGQLSTPTLVLAPPAVGGSVQMQNSTAIIQLQLAPGQSFASGTTVAQLNFQALPNQPSGTVNVPVAGAAGIKSNAAAYNDVAVLPGQIVVVGSQPLLQTQVSTGSQGRAFTLFGNPGSAYEVQFTTNLAPPVVWSVLVNHQQGSVSDTVNVDGSQPTIYYRVRQF